MPKDERPRVTIDRNWKPPKDFDPKTVFRQKVVKPYAQQVGEPYGAHGERVRFQVHPSLSPEERGIFSDQMKKKYREWCSRACWDGEHTVRVSLSTWSPETLSMGLCDVEKGVIDTITEIIARRTKKKSS